MTKSKFPDSRPWLIDALLPAYEVHLLGGPSGSGKTRWLFDLIENWQAGNSIFGFASHPVPYVYCAADRSYASVCDTCRDIGLDPSKVPILPALDLEKEGGYSIAWLMGLIKTEFPAARLVLLEGIGTFVPGGKTNDYHVVSKFLRDLSRACRKEQVTIWGVHHTSKEKGKEGAYENSREKLLGSAAWSAFAESIFMLDLIKAGQAADPYRRLSVFPRNRTAGFVVNYKFGTSGRLIMVNPSEVPTLSNRTRPKAEEVIHLVQKFAEEKGAACFDMKEILLALPDQPERTVFRIVGEMVGRGYLAKVKFGTYRLLSMKQLEGVLLP